jgi:hypothetical protein
MGWRYAVAWIARQRRTWIALAAAALATWLASRDHRAGWGFTVALTTFALAAGSIRVDYVDAHPDRRRVREERNKAAIESLVRRYDGDRATPKERERRQVEAIVARFERERAAAARAVVTEPARGLEEAAGETRAARRARERAERRQAEIDAIVARFESRPRA